MKDPYIPEQEYATAYWKIVKAFNLNPAFSLFSPEARMAMADVAVMAIRKDRDV